MVTAMQLDSSNVPIYLPEKEQTSVLRLGFENCSGDDWIFSAKDLNVFQRHKTELGISRSEECFAQTQGSVAAQCEFHDFLLRHLLTKPKSGYSRKGNQLIHEQEKLTWKIEDKNLWEASLWVPEDFCLLEKEKEGYVMTAASVCFSFILGSTDLEPLNFSTACATSPVIIRLLNKYKIARQCLPLLGI